MSSAVANVAKPQLRGLLQSKIRKNLGIAIVLSAIGGALYQTFVCNARKKKYADFYKTYDAQAEFDRMRKHKLFQSTTVP